jgi:hypothetical protein
MVTIERKNLEQVLDALEKTRYRALCDKIVDPSINIIKEALAQPTQEPADCHITGICVRSGLYVPPTEPRNFCSRCGKRTADLTVIHTCTPPEGGFQ